MKREIITIAGAPGSGKSSTADLVAKNLNFQRFSSGDFMRKIALEMGITINELQTVAENDKTIDYKIDEEVKKAGELNKVVIDSRLAFHWMPGSFKVYLDLPPQIAKQRILNNLKTNLLRQKSEGSSDIEEIYQKITSRLESEKKRYKELYDIDHMDKNNFDLIVDTDKNNLQEVVKIITAKYQEWLEK
ncbi:MAG: cytidylate kinase family protein [Patescibacteria group bacterium]